MHDRVRRSIGCSATARIRRSSLISGTHAGGSAALWATILAQVNPKGRIVTIDIKQPPPGHPPGPSITSLLTQDSKSSLMLPIRHTVSVVEGPFRFVLSHDTSMATGTKTELFDGRNDPEERKNVKQDHPEVAEDLRERALDDLENTSVPWSEGNPSVELSEEQLELLREFGDQVP